MLKRPLPRFAIIAIVVLWVVISLLPTWEYRSLSEEEKETRRLAGTLAELEHSIINLGLDLQGGIHLVLEVDIPTLLRTLAENKDDRLEQVISETATLVAESDDDFFDLFAAKVEEHNLRLIRYYSAYGTKIPEIIEALEAESDDAVNRSLEIIRNRVDEFGVSEPTIQKAGGRRIIVELAGIKDPQQARNLIQSTALLEFNILQDLAVTRDVLFALDEVLKSSGQPAEETVVAQAERGPAEDAITGGLESVLGSTRDRAIIEDDSEGDGIPAGVLAERPFSGYVHVHGNNLIVEARYRYAVEALLGREDVQAAIPSDGAFLWGNRTEELPVEFGVRNFHSLYYLYREPGLTGGVITEARANIGGLGSNAANQPVVNLSMNNEGSQIWARLTGANIGRRVALVLDKKVHMAPEIRGKIAGGSTVIEGLDSMEEAKLIAIVLRAGSLPAPVEIILQRSIGPSLGQDSIASGIRAALIGGLLVVAFIVFYYKGSGLIATTALTFNIFIVLAALASLSATLTLPGIAGLILTVGMAVDANVLIFERIREELDKGKSVRAAIDAGYARATVTIIDANVTTILAALVLFQFGSGPIKGFAITLFWGITASMFTAIFVTRTIFMAITQRPTVKTISI